MQRSTSQIIHVDWVLYVVGRKRQLHLSKPPASFKTDVGTPNSLLAYWLSNFSPVIMVIKPNFQGVL